MLSWYHGWIRRDWQNGKSINEWIQHDTTTTLRPSLQYLCTFWTCYFVNATWDWEYLLLPLVHIGSSRPSININSCSVNPALSVCAQLSCSPIFGVQLLGKQFPWSETHPSAKKHQGHQQVWFDFSGYQCVSVFVCQEDIEDVFLKLLPPKARIFVTPLSAISPCRPKNQAVELDLEIIGMAMTAVSRSKAEKTNMFFFQAVPGQKTLVWMVPKNW